MVNSHNVGGRHWTLQLSSGVLCHFSMLRNQKLLFQSGQGQGLEQPRYFYKNFKLLHIWLCFYVLFFSPIDEVFGY